MVRLLDGDAGAGGPDGVYNVFKQRKIKLQPLQRICQRYPVVPQCELGVFNSKPVPGNMDKEGRRRRPDFFPPVNFSRQSISLLQDEIPRRTRSPRTVVSSPNARRERCNPSGCIRIHFLPFLSTNVSIVRNPFCLPLRERNDAMKHDNTTTNQAVT